MDARREDVLDTPYFHLVFTVPDILNPLIHNNQKLLYDAMYHAASAAIRELSADPALLEFLQVLSVSSIHGDLK